MPWLIYFIIGIFLHSASLCLFCYPLSSLWPPSQKDWGCVSVSFLCSALNALILYDRSLTDTQSEEALYQEKVGKFPVSKAWLSSVPMMSLFITQRVEHHVARPPSTSKGTAQKNYPLSTCYEVSKTVWQQLQELSRILHLPQLVWLDVRLPALECLLTRPW